MVRATDFGPGKTALWVLQNKWRSDILKYGTLCATAAMTRLGTEGWTDAQLKCSKALVALYTRIAEMELRAQECEQV